jgi:ABC-type branched-subunit amino acid transport system permease subunit
LTVAVMRWPALAAAMALFLAVPLAAPGWIVFVLTLALAKFMAVLAVALFLRGGLISFGHALFYGIGAYAVGFSIKWLGVADAVLLAPMGAVLGAGVAAVVGLFVARYRGVFFAMLNLGISMILYAVLLKFYWVTGGTDGIGVRSPTFLGIAPPREILRTADYYFALLLTGGVIYGVYRFLASPVGYFLRALGDNEVRIEYQGESVRRVIYLTYILSGALGGLGGVLAAFTVGHIVPEYAYWAQSGEFVFVALLGGYGSVPGPLIGSLAFELIRTYASKYMPEAWQATLGVTMLLIIMFLPGGLWTLYEAVTGRARRGSAGFARG